jgi:hypothetical protein
VNSISGFRELKFRKHCNKNRDILKHDILTAKGQCGATGFNKWTGGMPLIRSQPPLMLFWVFVEGEVSRTLHLGFSIL